MALLDLFKRKRRILVAEDDPGVREMVRDVLALSGFAVDAAADGLQALQKLKSGRYDLVVLDVNMPGADGIQVLQAIRISPSHGKVGVIMLTGEKTIGTMNEAFAQDVFAYMVKPVAVPDLVAKVRSYFEAGKKA